MSKLAKMSHYVATVLLILAMASPIHCIQELVMVRNHILEMKNWVGMKSSLMKTQKMDEDPGGLRVALSDCATLYDESESRMTRLISADKNYTSDDATTWLSSVLANHRTCLDGLSEKGFVENYTIAPNITSSLDHALALFANGGLTWKRAPARPRLIYRNSGGLLTAWNPATSKANFIVSMDGSGTHRTIKEAVAAIGRLGGRRGRVIVYVKAGVYHEQVDIPRHARNVMFVGDGMGRTIITSNRSVRDSSSTLSSATFGNILVTEWNYIISNTQGVSGDGFWARDITFENTAGPEKHQAVALRVSSDHSVFYRCGIRGHQDTLYAHSLRQFYRDCHIYGTIDFIFGDAPVVLQNCDIFVRTPMRSQDNMITAQGRDNPNENTGISIQNSRVRPSQDFISVKGSYKTYLGRPWKKYSRTVFLKTDLDGLIDPKGWTEWRGDYGLSTLFYAEYMNTGAGATTDKRVRWPGFHVLNNPQQASPFYVRSFIQGEYWLPESGVPFDIEV